MRVPHAEEGLCQRQRVRGERVEKQERRDCWWATTLRVQSLSSPRLWSVGHHRGEMENQDFNVRAANWGLNPCCRHDPRAIVDFC